MNELTVPLTPQQEIDIQTALENLFVVQDKPVKKNQIAIFLDEIIRSRKPFGAIIKGIEKLKHEDIRKMSYAVIEESISDCIERKEMKTDDFCHECRGSGFIVSKDGEGRSFGRSCFCRKG